MFKLHDLKNAIPTSPKFNNKFPQKPSAWLPMRRNFKDEFVLDARFKHPWFDFSSARRYLKGKSIFFYSKPSFVRSEAQRNRKKPRRAFCFTMFREEAACNQSICFHFPRFVLMRRRRNTQRRRQQPEITSTISTMIYLRQHKSFP